MKLEEKLVALRKEKRLSQIQLAEMMNTCALYSIVEIQSK